MLVIESKVDLLKKIIYKDRKYFYYAIVFCNSNINPDTLTICISTQIGCVENCKFCATGDHGFVRNLNELEIRNEMLDGLECMKSFYEKYKITKLEIICEGMGEALFNITNCMEALKKVYDKVSKMFNEIYFRITTVGNAQLLNRYIEFINENSYLNEKIKFQIKFSLHTPFDEERNYLCPRISKNLLAQSMEILYDCANRLNDQLICNYMLLDYPNGKNNYSNNHLEELTRILNPNQTRLLLTHYSENGKGFKSPDETVFREWKEKLTNEFNFKTTITNLKGMDIGAACGMLHYE